MPEKLDLKKRYKELYSAKGDAAFVHVPEFAYFAVDGKGDPNEKTRFEDLTASLYSAAYILKFTLKKSRGLDWAVMPLEGDWRSADLSSFAMDRKAEWTWTLRIVQPGEVSEAEAKAAIEAARKKKPELAGLSQLRFERMPAHEAAHILHIGPYEMEAPTIAILHAFIEAEGCQKNGDHREIYLGDPRKGDPSKLKTIIRQPLSRPGKMSKRRGS